MNRAAAYYCGIFCAAFAGPGYAAYPTLTVTSPQDGFVTRASSVAVSGTAFAADGAGPVSVTVNSVAAPVAADGSFGGSVVLSEWGNAITVLAEDALGQVSAVYLNVEQDLLPPSVWFFGAEEGQVLNQDQLTPNCGASDEFIASAQATVNGLPFTCGDTISGFGTYTFVMDAVDQAGNSAHLAVSFALAMPPQLVVSTPADGLITNVQAFSVAGTAAASPGAGPMTVTINGVGVPVAADGSFTGTASLQEGWQLVDVEATDAFGQSTTLIPQVVLDTVPPDVYFQIEDDWVTADSFVPICGGSDSNLVSLQATLDGQPFTCGDMVSAEGPHTLSVAATDAAGNHSEVTNTFAIDRTPPQISVSGVADGITVVAPVSVQVTSADAHPLDTTVLLDGQVVGAAFTITQPGPHVLRVDSADLVFNCAVVELHFTVDPEDLAATIVSPADGTTTSDPIADVVVAINAGHPISQATANGVPLALQADGLYHASVSLVEGVNEVQVVVTDSTCAQVTRTVTVVLSSRAAALVAQIASSATAGQSLSLVIRALDVLGNLDTSYRGSVHLTSTDSQALLPGDYTFTATDAGEHSFLNGIVFRTAGAPTLSATDGTLSVSQAGIVVSAGAAAQLILRGIPSPIAAGAATSFDVLVTDSFANAATGYTGTVSFASSDPQAVLPAPYTFTGSDAGAHAFAGALALFTAGLQSVTATDGAISGSQMGISVTDTLPPVWPPGSAVVAVATSTTTAHLSWNPANDNVGVTAYRIYRNGVLEQTLGAVPSTDVGALVVGVPTSFLVQAGDAAGNWSLDGPSATVTTVPPDPHLIAPPIDTTVPTTLADSTAFLYTGPSAIQTGVAPGTIDAKRVSIARGMVRDRTGDAMTAVRVSVLSHPELGQTLTRADGAYDLAVNGGSPLTLVFQKSGFLDAQRTIDAAWQELSSVPDVVMVPQDPAVTLVDLGNTAFAHVASGSVTTDELGSRRAAVFFPPGTTATLVMPDGSVVPTSTLHFRATEYTVGAGGMKAMPSTLPPSSMYTYAVEFNADEETASGAKSVRFSQTVYAYVENFLAFRVGAVVPNGYYDRDLGAWVPQANGRVIEILSVTNGLADVDADGSGLAADASRLAALNLSDSERERLGALYAPGQTLWRMPLQHFSVEDFNQMGGPPVAAAPPPRTPPSKADDPVCNDERNGSIIECQTQVLGERIEVAGTSYSLNYRSSRQRGRRASYRLDIPLPAATSASIPNGIANCFPSPGRNPPCAVEPAHTVPVPSRVYVDIAGRGFINGNSAAASTWHFEWDGVDAYGRRPQGEQPITVRSCLVYPNVLYYEGRDAVAAFAAGTSTGSILSSRSNGPGWEWEDCWQWKGKLGGWDDLGRGLGGWTLSPHHVYDARNKTVYRGDGERSSGTSVDRLVSNLIFGGGTAPLSDGAQGTAVTVPFQTALGNGLAVAPDGTVYFNYWREVWKRTTDGTIHHVLGNRSTGVPFAAVTVLLAAAADGSIYAFDQGSGSSFLPKLWRILPDGSSTTLLTLSSGDLPTAIAIGPDRSVYYSDRNRHVVRKFRLDGTVVTVAGVDGATSGAFDGDGGPATSAHLSVPLGIAFGTDGTLYIADHNNNRIRAVDNRGIIRTVAGNGGGFFGGLQDVRDGPALSTETYQPESVAVVNDGTIFFGHDYGVLRRLSVDGMITSLSGKTSASQLCSLMQIDCPIGKTNTGSPMNLALAPDGSLYFTNESGARIERMSSGFTAAELLTETYVASSDATEVYVFDSTGRHLRTLDALTTALKLRFAYDSAGRLISVTDPNGNATTIERDGQGNPTAIVGPYGQRTTLDLDGNGYLASISNPASEIVNLAYQAPVAGDAHSGGLLSQLTDARGGIHLFEHDAEGFLTRDTPPDGAFQSLDRHGSLSPAQVTHTTALGRTTSYSVTWSSPVPDTETSSVTDGAGLVTTTVTTRDLATSTTRPDGMVVTTSATPDPRFGMDAFAVSSTSKTPAGLTRTVSSSRSATMATVGDPLTLSSLIESVSVNGRTSQSSYNGTTRRMTLTTAAGRVTTMDYDALGRVVQIAPPGVQPLLFHYDSHGRNDSITQGTRLTTMSYRADGFLASIVDPLQRATSFDYDLAGRPTSATLPDQSVIGTGYDASGNVISVTPPGRPAHAFSYTPADLESDYTPPGGAPFNTHTSYNLDQQVSHVSHPDGDFISPTYDPVKGRLTSFVTSRGTTAIGYSPTTGQVTSVTTPDGVGLTYAYDGALLKSVTSSGPVAGSVQRSYDASFRISSETYGGQTISYGYDSDDLLISAGAMTITRNSGTGFGSGATLGSVTESRTYNAFGEEQSYSSTAGTTPLYSVDYGTRDALGRIVNKTETVQGEAHVFGYSYDAQGRLTDVTRDGAATAHYEYDANGNRTVAPGLTASPVYDNQDRLLSYGNCSYAYKADGSLQTKTCPDGATSYDYDAFGNLRHVTLPNGTNIDYVIDGQNRRIGKKVNGALVEGFLYRSRLQPAAWLNGDGSVRATFVYGLRSNVPEYMVQGGTTYRLITDQVGSVRLVMNSATGAIIERIDWDEFGNVLSDSAPGTQPFGFAGGLRDLDGGLVRFGARDYDAATGRWTAKDPILFVGGTPELYEYSGNDPINQSDPSGLTVTCTFNRATGQLNCTDDMTGASASGPAESGGKPYGDPIPDGVYEILGRDGRTGFFRLDPVDSSPRDDIHQPTRRDNFRLHRPGRTVGCIAAKNWDDWNKIDSLIRDTSGTFGVRDRAPVPLYTRSHWFNTIRYITYYGKLTVTSR